MDVAAAAGLTTPNVYGSPDKNDYILETTGNGVAIFDFDGDGDLDIYVTNGPGSDNGLFSNQLQETGELTFVEQLLDSVNYPGRALLYVPIMPVGLRYHALHHLFPTMPVMHTIPLGLAQRSESRRVVVPTSSRILLTPHGKTSFT